MNPGSADPNPPSRYDWRREFDVTAILEIPITVTVAAVTEEGAAAIAKELPISHWTRIEDDASIEKITVI